MPLWLGLSFNCIFFIHNIYRKRSGGNCTNWFWQDAGLLAAGHHPHYEPGLPGAGWRAHRVGAGAHQGAGPADSGAGHQVWRLLPAANRLPVRGRPQGSADKRSGTGGRDMRRHTGQAYRYIGGNGLLIYLSSAPGSVRIQNFCPATNKYR